MKQSHAAVPALLREAGLRATRQRTTLLAVLMDAGGPLSIDSIVRAGKGAFDVATAYRTLDTCTAAGLVRRVELAQGHALFEIAGAHHHHAVCVGCGIIADVDACVPKTLDADVRKKSGFARIDSHSLEFFGLCTSCV